MLQGLGYYCANGKKIIQSCGLLTIPFRYGGGITGGSASEAGWTKEATSTKRVASVV